MDLKKMFARARGRVRQRCRLQLSDLYGETYESLMRNYRATLARLKEIEGGA